MKNPPVNICISIPQEGPRGVCITLPKAKPRLIIPIRFPGGFIVKGENLMTTLSDIQKVTIGPVSGVDAKGNPAPLENVRFASSDETILTVTPSADGLSADVVAVGPLGTAQVTAKADPKIGPDEGELIGTVDFEVVSSEATTLSIPVGAPVNQ